MAWRRLLFVPLVLVGLTAPAPAGIFSRKPAKPPTDRVSEAIGSLRNDPDERKRVAAAAELARLDPKHHGEIVPALLDALTRDPSPGVRAEVVGALGKMRPVQSQVGATLEQVGASDPSPRVREAAKSALMHYHVHGYRSAPKGAEPTSAVQTTEPPLVGAAPPPPPAPRTAPPASPARTPAVTETVEPPIAPAPQPVTAPTSQPVTATTPVARPMPAGPATTFREPPVVRPPSLGNDSPTPPAPAVTPVPPPAPAPSVNGPSLNPPG
jgi:hypothetical protein